MRKEAIWTCGIVGVLLVISVLATACTSRPTPQPTSSPLSAPESSEPSPEPSSDEERPQPTSAALVSVLPTPDPNWGTVTGRLISAADGKPLEGVVAFLEHTTPEHNIPPVLYAPPNNQPRAKTDEEGEFVISAVPEGEYVVILFWPPFDLQVVTEADGDTPMLINIRPGKVVDIGTIRATEFQLSD